MNGPSPCFILKSGTSGGQTRIREGDDETTPPEQERRDGGRFLCWCWPLARTRMKSALPKVLHPVAGGRFLEHVLKAAGALRAKELSVVLGVGRDQVQKEWPSRAGKSSIMLFRTRPKGAGTPTDGEVLAQAQRGALLVFTADTPLLTAQNAAGLGGPSRGFWDAATFWRMGRAGPSGYGRMILDGQGYWSGLRKTKMRPR